MVVYNSINDYGDPIPIDDINCTYDNQGESNILRTVTESPYGNAAQGINPEYALEIYYEKKRL